MFKRMLCKLTCCWAGLCVYFLHQSRHHHVVLVLFNFSEAIMWSGGKYVFSVTFIYSTGAYPSGFLIPAVKKSLISRLESKQIWLWDCWSVSSFKSPSFVPPFPGYVLSVHSPANSLLRLLLSDAEGAKRHIVMTRNHLLLWNKKCKA